MPLVLAKQTRGRRRCMQMSAYLVAKSGFCPSTSATASVAAMPVCNARRDATARAAGWHPMRTMMRRSHNSASTSALGVVNGVFYPSTWARISSAETLASNATRTARTVLWVRERGRRILLLQAQSAPVADAAVSSRLTLGKRLSTARWPASSAWKAMRVVRTMSRSRCSSTRAPNAAPSACCPSTSARMARTRRTPSVASKPALNAGLVRSSTTTSAPIAARRRRSPSSLRMASYAGLAWRRACARRTE
mmetsp:Transcript_88132/g.196058  ORF Transcript_88132/g.196058 Transcript_88132/m.196058 type:complete len:250 (+) Transcript_88132:624-1373(+)